jgi:hypothetical protein
MEKRIVQSNGATIAVVYSGEPVITDAQSALDLVATLGHEDACDGVAINKEAIIEDFFKLSTGIAGEILQKFVNYSMRIAIIGDFSKYTSKPLKDFIYECNQGNAVYFVSDEQTAINKLAKAQGS